MKAILIMNVPEDFDYRKCSIGGDGNIYYEREGEQRTSIIGNIKNLKPIPQKKILDEELLMFGNFRFIQARFTGWNDCIDEILRG